MNRNDNDNEHKNGRHNQKFSPLSHRRCMLISWSCLLWTIFGWWRIFGWMTNDLCVSIELRWILIRKSAKNSVCASIEITIRLIAEVMLFFTTEIKGATNRVNCRRNFMFIVMECKGPWTRIHVLQDSVRNWWNCEYAQWILVFSIQKMSSLKLAYFLNRVNTALMLH